MPDHYTIIKPKEKLTFPDPVKSSEQYEHPIGPQTPQPGERLVSKVAANPHLNALYNAVKPTATKAIKFAKERSENYVRETQLQERNEHKRKQNTRMSQPSRINYNMNPFGVGVDAEPYINDSDEKRYKNATTKHKRRTSKPLRMREDSIFNIRSPF